MTKETVVPGFGRPLRRVGVGVLAATTAVSACLGAVVLIARGLSVSAAATASPVWGHPMLAVITLGVVVGELGPAVGVQTRVEPWAVIGIVRALDVGAEQVDAEVHLHQ